MEKRTVFTRIWRDNWFSNLNRSSRMVFMYCITNPYLGFSGFYECPDRLICFEADVTPAELADAKLNLRSKVTFADGWVFVKNAEKLDPIKGENNPLWKAYEKEIAQLPTSIKDKLTAINQEEKDPMETLVRGYEAPQVKERVKVLSNKKGGVGENKPTEEEMLRVAELYQVPLSFVESKWDDVVNHCLSKGKTYSDYVAALRSFVKKDAIERIDHANIANSKRGIDASNI